MAIATVGAPESNYVTGQFTSGSEAVITIYLNTPLMNDLQSYQFGVYDLEHARIYRNGGIVPSNWWSLEKVSDTEYRIRYRSPYSITSVFIGGLTGHPEISGITGQNSFTIGPPPQDVTFNPEDFFLYNGETTTVAFTVNLRRRRLSINNLSVSAGHLSNFRGSGHNYRVDITAPSEGFGIIELRINSFQSGLIEEFLHAPRPTEDILFVSRKKPVPHLAREDEIVYFQEVGESDLDDLNDFNILIIFDQNVTGFTEDKISLYAIDENNDVVEAVIVEFSGKGSVYEATVRVLSLGGAGKVVVGVPRNATDQGNPEKSLTICYDDELIIPDWEVIFVTKETYNDIVSVSSDGMQLLRGNQIDLFSFEGEIDSERQVKLPNTPTVTRAVRYDTDKYLGLATSKDFKAHLFVAGATDWSSEAVFTLATDRFGDSSSEIRGLAVNDWVWTRERQVVLASMPFQNHAASIGALPALEIHKAIREGTDLNDVVFDEISVDYGELDTERWDGLVAVAHAEGKLFVGSNETATNEQNYIFVFDADYKMMLGQQIPVSGRTKSLFAKNGWLYRYNDSTKAMMRFPLDALRLPEPKKEIYLQIVRPGDVIDAKKFVRFADRVVFDVRFEKPPWLSMDDSKVMVAEDAPVKSTAYVRLRGINNNGASLAGSFGFYVYVRELRSPEWKKFGKLSMYHNQEINLHAYVEGAETIEWQKGADVPDGVVLENGKIRYKE